jgi:hypothetical protein
MKEGNKRVSTIKNEQLQRLKKELQRATEKATKGYFGSIYDEIM